MENIINFSLDTFSFSVNFNAVTLINPVAYQNYVIIDRKKT